MDLHNVSEDIVFGVVRKIFEAIEKEGNAEGLCLCEQCRMDTICYVLNRLEPRYIISSRGINHIEQDWAWKQQIEADASSLAYKGLRMVNHQQRPSTVHGDTAGDKKVSSGFVFDIPTIIGRIFDGETFAPIADVKVELWSDGKLVSMRNQNWQNPFSMVSKTPGTFTFWPAQVSCEAADTNRLFSYAVKVDDKQYEPISHHFNIPTVSTYQASASQPSAKTFKLPDLYLFPPGKVEMSD